MKKIFTGKRMKICATQGLIAILLSGATLAHDNHAQVLDRKISLQIYEAAFDEALNQIARQAKIKFAYSPELLNIQGPITLHIEDRPVREILTELFSPRNITYTLQQDGVTVSLKPVAKRSKHIESSGAEQQKMQALIVTGTVTDVLKQPMAGVSVLVKGTATGTMTDTDGIYSIEALETDVLIFSSIGYLNKEVKVGNKATMDIILEEEVTSLKEVVVNVGYWEVKEKEQTGNVSRITADEIKNQPINNPLQAMQGRMPGVYIQQNTGVPGGGFKIQIRGQNSLRVDGNDPLYVIDGIPFTATALNSRAISGLILKEGSPLASINPADIESIEILKDADATAIYGSRGSNGVVLITTKRGKSGKTKLDINVASGVAQVSHNLDLLNTNQYVNMRKEALRNDGLWPLPSSLHSIVPDVFLWDTTRQTNWQQELIGNTAKINNAQLSLSGGNEHTKFSIGGGYYKETTVFPGDFNFQRISGNLSFSHTSPNKKLRITTSINYTTTLNKLVPLDFTSLAVTLPPNAPALYKEDGTINWDWQNNELQNPIALTKRKYSNRTLNMISSASITYEVFPGLQLKSSMGYTTMQVDELSTSPISAIPPQFLFNQTGASSFGDGNIHTWIVEPQAVYEKRFEQGSLNITLGSTFQQSVQDMQTITARGYASDALLENIKAATSWEIASTEYSKYRYSALFARVNYNWKERYIINLTARRDGSSRFGPGNRFGNFGAVGVAWILSNEGFIQKHIGFISFAKLRASYGLTGSDAIGNYQYLSTYAATTYPYNNGAGLVVNRLSNTEYSWESNKKFEVGFDVAVLEDKISAAASYYRNRAANQLVGLPLPLITGQSSVQYNLPAIVQNRGWEFILQSKNLSRGSFSWNTSFNLTIPRNELVAFPMLAAFPAYSNKYTVGKSIFTRKTLTYTGVNPETGLYTFNDKNDNGRISLLDDGEFKKEIAQKFFGGVNNSWIYGGFQLDIFVQFVKQSGYGYVMAYPAPGAFSNQPAQVWERWTQPGDDRNIQMYSFVGDATDTYSAYMNSDRAIVDASFIRIKNVSLSWKLPERWLTKTGLSMCRLYVLTQNLFTITDYIGMDPENQNVGFLPPLRTMSIGLNLTL